ncbi:hypothetical protein JYK22_40980, partial [Nonomuraea sp. RK-328]|nr:hypothetical protein [Nonomuraea sp. RK-328]
MIKVMFTTVLVAAGLGFGLAGTANAAPQATVTKPADNGVSAYNLWYAHSTWSNERACHLTGQDLRTRGEIINYYCEPRGVGTPYPFWVLHVYVD